MIALQESPACLQDKVAELLVDAGLAARLQSARLPGRLVRTSVYQLCRLAVRSEILLRRGWTQLPPAYTQRSLLLGRPPHLGQSLTLDPQTDQVRFCTYADGHVHEIHIQRATQEVLVNRVAPASED